MRPIPIDEARIWPGACRRVIGPPPGHDVTGPISAVEVLIDEDPELGRRFHLRIRLDAGDLQRLNAEPEFWLILYGSHLHPFALVHDQEAP